MFVGLEPVTVELTLFTDSLVVTGRVTTPHRRVTDILNLAEGPFLVLDQVTVDEHGTRGQMSSLPFAQVNLDTILFAIADSVIEPNPTTGGVKPAAALISVPPFSVAGNVHLLGDGDARAALQAQAERFVAVTDATYWSDQVGTARRQSALVAVNHRRAQYIAPHREVDPWAGLGYSGTAASGGADGADGTAGEPSAGGGPSLEPAPEA